MSLAAPRFTQVNGRRVAWRAAGSGPAALLLHGSPQSSRALAGLGEAVAAAGLCAIMPDTPGAGRSEPLPGAHLTIMDLAEALAAFADSIGLGRVALYGTHTGAAIAASFAARYPERVSALVLDGIAAWEEPERAAYRTSYAPPFEPSWDGSHMTWLWARMEAQSVYFPWHGQRAATWRGVDLSPPWHLHRNAMDMLECGDAYRPLYQASLAFDPAEVIDAASPARMMMLATDVLRQHATRPALRHLPLELFETPPVLWQAVVAALAANPGDDAPAFPSPGMFWRGTLEGPGKPTILLHPAGASSRFFAAGLPAYPGPVLAFDLPGHGFDETTMPDSAAAIAALIDKECRTLGITDYTAAGARFGAVIARLMQNPCILAPASTAPDLATNGAVSLEPVWDGSHLLRAWRIAWRQAVFDPWYVNTAPAAAPADLDPVAIHAAAVDLLRAGGDWMTANGIEAGK
jgi:pimeloyl-ACP methyl ester carboxylesterase